MATVLQNMGGIERLRGEPIIYTEGIYSVELNPGLQEWEVEDAFTILRWIKGSGPFLGIAGTMLVSGLPRQGKGLFGNVFAWKIKRYFRFKKVLRDDHPTELFGPYIFFSEDTVLQDVNSMADVSEQVNKDARGTKAKTNLRRAVNQWVADEGEVKMQDSVVLKDEFWKDMNKRRSMSTMNLVFSGLLKTSYHIDMLTIGIVQTPRDLDRFSCLPWVNLHVKCTWCQDMPNTTAARLYHVRWSDYKQTLVPIPPTDKKPILIFINGATPRPELSGAGYFDIFKSKAAPNLTSLTKNYLSSSATRAMNERIDERRRDEKDNITEDE